MDYETIKKEREAFRSTLASSNMELYIKDSVNPREMGIILLYLMDKHLKAFERYSALNPDQIKLDSVILSSQSFIKEGHEIIHEMIDARSSMLGIDRFISYMGRVIKEERLLHDFIVRTRLDMIKEDLYGTK